MNYDFYCDFIVHFLNFENIYILEEFSFKIEDGIKREDNRHE